MSEEKTFGEYHCDLPGHEAVWVRFQPSGYPFALRRQWREEREDDKTLKMVFEKTVAWHIIGLDGKPVGLPEAMADRKPSLLDNTEGAVVIWLIQTFTRFLLFDSGAPPKNSLPPSTGT